MEIAETNDLKLALSPFILNLTIYSTMGQYWILINVDRREIFVNHGSVKMGGMRALFTQLVEYLTLPTPRTALSTATGDGTLKTRISG